MKPVPARPSHQSARFSRDLATVGGVARTPATVLLALILIVVGCGSDEEPLSVRLHERNAGESLRAPSPGRPLRIAVAPILSPKRNLLLYQKLVDHLGAALECRAELVVRDTYAEVNHLLRERLIQVAFICTYPYVKGRESSRMEIVAAPVPARNRQLMAYLIVRKDRPYKSLADLRDRRFAFSDPLSNTGMLLPTYHLLEMGETPDSFFRETIFTYSHSSSIRSVVDGQVDAASVLSFVWEFENDTNPDLTRQTAILERWKSEGLPPVVVHPRLDPALKAGLRKELLRLHETPDGRRILESLEISRFVIPKDAQYETVRKMAAQVEESWQSRQGR
jgi:phosphonate transport system substrate-binding protein